MVSQAGGEKEAVRVFALSMFSVTTMFWWVAVSREFRSGMQVFE